MKGENTQKIVTRFAPSPTGFMHVGNVRTAIFAYLWAKHTGGTFILRIEDTDKAREVEGSKEHIMEALTWLGITWDQGPIVGGPHAPYIQSERLDIYQKYAHILIEKGYAYVDGTSEEEAEKLRIKADEEKRPFIYREHRIESSEPYTGKGQSLRFKINEVKKTSWQDVAFGELTAGEEALDDFILIKADGYPTYNFAHVIDDIEMGVTHVMRGQEFISSTPKFLALYNALEITPPVFVSMPHILGDNGQKKLGKRDGAKDILDYRTEGYEPQALFNFLAFLGFNPGGEKEIYTKQELVDVFDITRVQKSGARFNDEKLNWFNKEHIKLLPQSERIKKVAQCIPERFVPSDELITKIEPIVTERISTWSELKNCMDQGEFDYFFVDPTIAEPSKIIWKESTLEQAKSNLAQVVVLIDQLEASVWTYETLKNTIWPITETLGRGDVLWPLRYVLSGQDKSPDPFMMLYILGKETALKRIKDILG